MKNLDALVNSFCDLVLIKTDGYDSESFEQYIDDLSTSERGVLKNAFHGKGETKEHIQELINNKILKYLSEFNEPNSTVYDTPFVFDSGGNFSELQVMFSDLYKSKTKDKCPEVFAVIFVTIRHASNNYRLFEQYYNLRKNSINYDFVKDAKTQINQLSQKISDQMKESQNTLNVIQSEANKAKLSADQAAKNAKKAANDAIDRQIPRLDSRLTEKSVTILGIFSAVVLILNTFLSFADVTMEHFISGNPYRALFSLIIFCFVISNSIILLISMLNKSMNNKRQSTTPKKVFIINNAVIITLLVAVFVMWLTGFIECRNSHFSALIDNETNSVVQEDSQHINSSM